MRRRLLALLLCIAACGGTPARVPAEKAAALTDCTPPGDGQEIAVELPANATAEDVASWYAIASCRLVVLPHWLRTRSGSWSATKSRLLGGRAADTLFRDRLDAIGLFSVDSGSTTYIFARGRELDAAVAAGKAALVVTEAPPPRHAGDTSRGTGGDIDLDAWNAELDAGITSTGNGEYSITRALAEEFLDHPGARIVPSIKNGAPNGFKLYAIRPGSFYARIGFMNGDTILTVNGYTLDSVDKALEVFTKVREASRLELEITRRGKPIVLVINIQ